MDAPARVSAALCRCVAAPRVAVKAAALREALAFMGHAGDEGAEVVELAADRRMVGLFSAGEVQELLSYERNATVLALGQHAQQEAA